MRIYALGTLFVELTLGMNAFITAQGFATTGMLTVLHRRSRAISRWTRCSSSGCNMGVRGAALATVISQGVSCLWVVVLPARQKDQSCACKKENLKMQLRS